MPSCTLHCHSFTSSSFAISLDSNSCFSFSNWANAEYDAAREEQSHTEARIADLENKLAAATILDPKHIKTDKVYILTSVKLRNLDDPNEIIEYTLVSSEEADTDLGKISVRSPVGRALIGKGVGEKVSILVPKGELHFEILEIFVK